MPTDISAFTFHQDGLGCGLSSELYCFAGIEPAPESPEGRMPQEFYIFSFLLSQFPANDEFTRRVAVGVERQVNELYSLYFFTTLSMAALTLASSVIGGLVFLYAATLDMS